MANIQAGLEIKAGVSGVENIDALAQSIEAAGIDTGKLTTEAKELGATLAKAQAQQAAIAEYKALSAELDNTAKEMRALDELTATLEKSMRGGGTQQQQADLAKLRAESERLAKSETELTGKLYAARDAMSVSGVSVKNLAAEEARLSSESAAATAQLDRLTAEAQTLKAIADAKIQLGIDTDDKARQEIQKTKDAYELLKNSGTLSHEELARAAQLQEGKVRELEASLKGVKPSISEIASEVQGLVGKAGGLAFAAKEAMKFETAMAGVKKVAEGTDEQYAKLSDELKKMSAELGISAAEMADLAAAGGQLGIPIEKLSEFTAIASKMSVAFGMTAEEAGNAAATIANVFQLPIGEVEKLGDAINVLGNNTAAREKDIVAAMARIGGTAKQFGLAADEAAALADAFIALGKPPEVAATAINAMLQKLQTAQSQGKGFQAALEGIGTSADEMAANIAANPQQALTDFLHKLEGLDKQSRALMLSQLFGTEYSDDIALLVGSLGEYEKALGLVADKGQVVGAMQKEVANAMSTSEAQINKAKQEIINVAIEVGEKLLPLVSLLASTAGSVASAIGAITEEFPVLTQLATLFAAGAVAVKAYEAAVRLTGGAVSASFATQRVGIEATKASILSTTVAARELGIALKSAAAGNGFGNGAAAAGALAQNLKTAASNAGLLFAAFEVGRGVGGWLRENTDLAKIFGDNLARIPAILDSLFTTGGLDKYHEFFKTEAQIKRELEIADKKAQEAAEKAAVAKKKAAEEEAAAVKALQAEYRASATELSALEHSMAALRADGRETSDFYSELAIKLENVRTKTAELKAELDKKNVKISADTGELAAAQKALEALGLTAEEVTTGMSKKAAEGIANFSRVASQFGNDAEQMGRVFQAALKQMDSKESTDALLAELEKVGKQSGLTAEEIKKIGDTARESTDKVADAFAKIGVDSKAVMTGISSDARQAFADFQTASTEAAAAGQKDAKLIQAAFEAMMGKLKSKEEFAEFQHQLKASGDAALLTQEQLARLGDAASGGAEKAKTAYQGLNDTAAKTGEAAKAAHEKGSQAAENHAQSVRKVATANKEAAAEADNAAKAAANASKSFSDYGYRLTQTAGFYKLNNEQLDLMNRQFSGIKLGMEATFRAAQMKEYTQQIYNANTAMQRLTNAAAQGAVTQDILNDAASAASRAADKLGNTELTKFRNAISDAQRRLNALRQEAHDATRALEAELAELNGNTEAVYSLQQERKIRELQQKLDNANRLKQTDVAREYQRQIDLQQQIYNRQRSKRAESAAQEQVRNQGSYGNSNAAQRLQQIGNPQVNIDPEKLNQILAQRDQAVAEKAVNGFMNSLQASLKRTT
ncbi:phage tail tape measure protein [Neisseria sp. P0009.S001]|uniref:phage tail tape measure protein n=1 Tax=unclassified Neisseria TaxID=2623750 RepID=UPI0008A29477|nr:MULTISPECIES: phage tail tape measure protein [unclassified Neisseria]OFK16997.1 phage tail tape measure protein [Neisseria sp. HMSC071A01]OFQ14911.1 phage tail tape measure protein [Neisseria sp. HMSC068C12]